MTSPSPEPYEPQREDDDSLRRLMADIETRLEDPTRLGSVERTLSRPIPPTVHALIRALAAELDVSFAAVTILDQTHQHFLSTNLGEMARCEIGSTGCQFVIGSGKMVALSNGGHRAWIRQIMAGWALPQPVVAYLGVPLKDSEGEVLGSVCVVDTKKRVWQASEHYALFETSQLVTKILSEGQPTHD